MSIRAAHLNVTPICDCGESKAPNRQWCDRCWDFMPEEMRGRFNRAMSYVDDEILACSKILERLAPQPNKKPLA